MENGIRIAIHVLSNARETKVLMEPDRSIVIRVNAPPVKGKANREIVKRLSKKLRKPSSQIRIVLGLGSDLKILEIVGMDRGSFLEAITQERAADS
jgi:uncharacterized protein (TIGR00251 family)